MLLVLTTVSDRSTGESLASQIVDARLAACVQMLPGMTSVYIWEGRVTTDGEHLLLIKTLPEKFDELSAFITANHSYEVPEIIAVEAARVSEPYLKWMEAAISVER